MDPEFLFEQIRADRTYSLLKHETCRVCRELDCLPAYIELEASVDCVPVDRRGNAC